jgi:hypothetical protein
VYTKNVLFTKGVQTLPEIYYLQMDRPNDHYKTNKDTTYHQNGQQLYQDQPSTQAGIGG